MFICSVLNMTSYVRVLLETCNINWDDSGCNRLRLLPHPLLWCWKSGWPLHIHAHPQLVLWGKVIPM